MERQHHSQVVSSWIPLNTVGSGSGHHIIPQNFTEKKSLNVKFINKYLAKLDFLILIWEILHWLSFYLANFLHTCVWKIHVCSWNILPVFVAYLINILLKPFLFVVLGWFFTTYLVSNAPLKMSGFETSSGVAISLHSWC